MRNLIKAVFAIGAFMVCLAGLIYLVTTQPDSFREPAAAQAGKVGKGKQYADDR